MKAWSKSVDRIRQSLQAARHMVRSASGQALVEFVILLIAIMILCAGMLYLSRTLQADWWAQHDARFLAWEKTWAPNWAGRNGPSLISDHAHFRRPRAVQRMQATYLSNRDGGLKELLQGATGVQGTPIPTPTAPPTPTPTPTPICVQAGCDSKGNGCYWDCWTPFAALPGERRKVLLAKSTVVDDRPLLYGKSDEWLRDAHEFLSGSSIAEAAGGLLREEFSPEDQLDRDRPLEAQGTGLAEPIVELLEHSGFGKLLCDEYRGYLEMKQAQELFPQFLESGCERQQNEQFGRYLSENVDLRELFLQYEEELDRGTRPGEALGEVVGLEAGQQFYRYFDEQVTSAFSGTSSSIVSYRIIEGARFAQDAAPLITSMRYMGSSIALTLMGTQMARIALLSASNRSFSTQMNLESSINRFLHADAADVGIPFIPLSVSGFWLPLTRIPIPPYYGIMAAGIYDGLFKNVLSRDSSLQNSLISNSNIAAQASYQTSGGQSKTVRKYWNKRHDLVAKYFLVTEPWHITRRTSASGGFRSVGVQTDGMDSSSEESVLRRRTVGLWLFPSDPVALLDPIKYAIPGSIGSVVDQIGSVRELIILAKRIVTDDNPLRTIFDAVMNLPGLSWLQIHLPQWPAVRPEAYPGSGEMQNDKLTVDGTRNFNAYVGEQ